MQINIFTSINLSSSQNYILNQLLFLSYELYDYFNLGVYAGIPLRNG